MTGRLKQARSTNFGTDSGFRFGWAMMDYPLVTVCEPGNRLANVLAVRAPDRRWVLRQARERAACAEAIPPGCPAVLVVEVGAGTARELELLAWAHEHRPDAAVVVVLRLGCADLVPLAWELGANYVAEFAPDGKELLAVIEGLIANQWVRQEAVGSDGLSRDPGGR